MLFKKEETLPLSKTFDVYKTSRKLKKGEYNYLPIKILEGESDIEDRNDFVCEVGIPGKDLPYDLPAGTPIELTVKINESRELSITSYIPLIDMSFNARTTLTDKEIDPDELSTKLIGQRKRSEAVFEYASPDEQQRISDALKSATESVNNARSDSDEKRKANKQLKNLQIMLDELEEEKKMPQLVREYNTRLQELDKIINEYADPKQKEENLKQLKSIKTDGDQAIKASNRILLSSANEQLENLKLKAIYSNPNTWIAAFRQLIDQDNFLNEEEAKYYINKGSQAIQAKNYEELKVCVNQLSMLRPAGKQKDIDLSGITR